MIFRAVLTLALGFLTLCARSQFVPDISLSDSVVSQVQLDAYMGVNATGISNHTLYSAYNGKYIDADQIATISDQLQSTNRMGYEIQAGFSYLKALDHGKFSYAKFSIRHQQIAFSEVSGDAIKLILQGNSQFEDQQATLHFTYRYTNLQKISYHLGGSKSNALRYEIGASILHGAQQQHIKLFDSWLYTAPYAEYLESEVHYTSALTTGNVTSGIGAAFDGNMTYEKGNNIVSLTISDAGAIAWSGVEKNTLDSTYRFDGLRIDNILNPQELNTENLNADSLENLLGLKIETRTQISAAPIRFQWQWQHQFSDKFKLQYGAQYILSYNVLPLLYVRGKWQLNDKNMLLPSVSYGGFGSYNIGLGYETQLREKLKLHLSSQYLDGLIVAKHKAGVAGYVSITYNL